MTFTNRRLIAILIVPFAVVLATVVVATYALPAVTLQVDQPTYHVGDVVRFSLRNGLKETVYLECTAPWQISREIDGAWQPVESHVCLAVIVPVAAGETRNWTWVSRTTDRPDLAPVEPGQYRIEMSVLTQCASPGQGCPSLQLTAFFRLQ